MPEKLWENSSTSSTASAASIGGGRYQASLAASSDTAGNVSNIRSQQNDCKN